jgi:hypothetical protein
MLDTDYSIHPPTRGFFSVFPYRASSIQSLTGGAGLAERFFQQLGELRGICRG